MQQPNNWNGITNGYIAPDWNTWIERLQQSEQQLKQMSEQMSQLQKQLDEISSKPPFHIEYHFDQLKVNRLEGTLNVGLSPQGIQELQSLEVPNPPCMTPKPSPTEEPIQAIRALQSEMNEYMNQHAASVLIEKEGKYGVTLEHDQRIKVIEDVKKQLPERVHYYARTAPYPTNGTNAELNQWSESIKEKTIHDIQSAYSAYLQKLKNQPPKEQ